MPTFTRPDGSPVIVPASSVARARGALAHEMGGLSGSALFKPRQMVREPIDVVGPALKAELAVFTMLHAPNAAPIWFDAVKAGDAEPPRANETSPNTNAVVLMAGVRQRVSETVAQAQQIIDAARGGA